MRIEASDDGGGGAGGTAGYLAPYARAVERHGASFESTLWASKPMQVRRFEVLAEMLDPTGLVMLDAGSGIGDFAAHLAERGVRYGRCVALEALEALHDYAASRGLARTACVRADFATEAGVFERYGADVVYFSGSLNTFEEDRALEVLRRAWASARVGVAFNFLSSRHHRRNAVDPAPARRFDPLRLLGWALDETPNVRFRQDYFDGHDGTIAMVRVGAGGGHGSCGSWRTV